MHVVAITVSIVGIATLALALPINANKPGYGAIAMTGPYFNGHMTNAPRISAGVIPAPRISLLENVNGELQ